MSIYRKVEIRMWTDRKFRRLSAPQPNAQDLWIWLLTGPRTTIFPGLVVATVQVMGSDLGWPVDAQLGNRNGADLFGEAFATPSGTRSGRVCRCVRDALKELVDEGMVEVDHDVGLVFLPRALFTGSAQPRDTAKPGSTNHLRGWAKSWETIPECDIKARYLQELRTFAFACSSAHGKAFEEAFARHLGTPSERVQQGVRKASRTRRRLDLPQEQDQEQEDPDPEYRYPSHARDRARDPATVHGHQPGQPPLPAVSNVVPLRQHGFAPIAPESLGSDQPTQAAADAQIARTALARRFWKQLNDLRAAIARELGQMAPQELPDLAAGWGHMAKRISEAPNLEIAAKQLEHVFSIAAAEARLEHRSVRYLTGDAMFKCTPEYNPWEIKLGMSVADVEQRASQRSTPARKGPRSGFSAFAAVDSATDLVEAALAHVERKPDP